MALHNLMSSFTPTPRDGGPSLLLGEDAASDAAEIRKFSKADARAYAEYNALLERYSAALRPLPPARSMQRSFRLQSVMVGTPAMKASGPMRRSKGSARSGCCRKAE